MVFTANGVDAPAPSRSQVRFIAAASQAAGLVVLNSLRQSGVISFAVFFVMPHSSATAASPIHTAYTQKSVSETDTACLVPEMSELKNSSGEKAAASAADIKNMAVNTAFIK